MAQKRLLYFTSRQVGAYRCAAGRLEAEALFANKEESVGEFARYLAGAPGALYYLLVDVVEEDFHQEMIPYVRGKDRRMLLGRRLAQRYRDLTLALALSLGYESGARREESILFSSFTNTQLLLPWLTALRTTRSRLVGVYSVPLLSPVVGKRIGFAAARYLMVSLQSGGLRQSYVENGHIRFSRLGVPQSQEPIDVAHECATESARIQQYLTNVRICPRDAGALDVVVLVPSSQVALFRAQCASTPQLRFQVFDLDQACRGAGLKHSPEGMLAERLFLHVVATAQPREQFAQESERRFYHIWRARLALVASGAAVLGFCLLLSGLRLMDVVSISDLTQADDLQQKILSAQYDRLQAQFPKTPTSRENLKGLVANYGVLEHQNASIDRIFGELSQALAASPQIELEKIDWRVGVAPRRTVAPGAAAAADNGERDYQVVEISGRVNVVQASDYRNITLLVDQFVQTLRQRPGFEVLSTRLPFDLAAEKSVSGDIGDERAAEVPRFTVLAAKRLGS